MAKKMIAAGGIVENEEGKILMMFRRGKWDLPKGKLDDGETIEQCAVREVEEETGLRNINLGNLVGITSHLYKEKGEEITKESHWYAMKVAGKQKLVPQIEEDIQELRWVGTNELENYLSNSYKNIIEIIETWGFNASKFEKENGR